MPNAWEYSSASFMATGAWEPQRDWQFEFIIKGLSPQSLQDTGILSGVMSNPVLSNVADEQTATVVKLAVQDVSLPRIDFQSRKIKKAQNRQKGIVTGYSIGNLDITFLDDCRQNMDRVLYNWVRACVDTRNGEYGKTDMYKKNGCLVKYSPDGMEPRFWITKGLFPLNYSQSRYSMTGRGFVTISMSFNVDNAYPATVKEITKEGFLQTMFL